MEDVTYRVDTTKAYTDEVKVTVFAAILEALADQEV